MKIIQIGHSILFFGVALTSTVHTDSKYINLQIRTGATGFVETVHIDTNLNNSLNAGDIKLRNSITTIIKNVGLVNDTQQPMPGAWFKITAQGGLIFDYVRTKNYATHTDNIADPELQQKVHNANIAFKKHLSTVDRSLGLNITADLPGDVMLNNNPYSAPARAMYKEMRKLAHAVGISLPDPDASLLRSCVKYGLPSLLLLGTAAFLYSNWGNVSSAFGTRTEQCGIGIQTVGTGVSKSGGLVESFGRGVQKFGTWIKTPAAPKASPAAPTAPTTTLVPTAPNTPVPTPAPEVTAPPIVPAPVASTGNESIQPIDIPRTPNVVALPEPAAIPVTPPALPTRSFKLIPKNELGIPQG